MLLCFNEGFVFFRGSKDSSSIKQQWFCKIISSEFKSNSCCVGGIAISTLISVGHVDRLKSAARAMRRSRTHYSLFDFWYNNRSKSLISRLDHGRRLRHHPGCSELTSLRNAIYKAINHRPRRFRIRFALDIKVTFWRLSGVTGRMLIG